MKRKIAYWVLYFSMLFGMIQYVTNLATILVVSIPFIIVAYLRMVSDQMEREIRSMKKNREWRELAILRTQEYLRRVRNGTNL